MQIVQTRGFRSIAVAILFFFTWSCCRLWAFAIVTPDASAQPLTPSAKTNTALEQYEEVLRVLHRTITDFERRLVTGEDITLDLAQLQGHRERIEAVDAGIRTQFQATEDKLKAAGLSAEILVRHQQMVAHYGVEFEKLLGILRRVEQLQSALQAAQHSKDPERIEATYEALKQLLTVLKASVQDTVTEPPHIPLDPNNLPHRTPTVKERKPRLQKDDFTELHKPVQLAFLGEPSSFLLAQATSELPAPEDLAETPEVPFTQAIQDLAAQLDHHPVKIYEYVRNNFDFEPTYGSIKGAQETLLAKSGNAMDLASLLIALLRVSGVPARYVMGTVAMPIASVMNWLGVQDPATANRVLTSGSIPAVQLVQEGVVTHMQLEHAWVTAYVDYVPSRGASHQTGDTWVELDPAFKQFERTAGIDLNEVVTFDAEQFGNALNATGTVNSVEGYATGFDQLLITQRLEERRQALEIFFRAEMPDATVGDVLGTETVQAENLGILPASLPYRVFVRGAALPELPDALRHKIRFQVSGLTVTNNLSQLAGVQITLSYVPATAQDRTIVEASAEESALPAYLIKVKPVLKFDGTTIATGTAVQLGHNQQLEIEFIQPFGSKDVTRHRIVAGSYHAIGLNLQTVLPERIEAIKAKAEAVRAQLTTNPNALLTADATMGLLLQAAIIGFWFEGDVLENMLARFMNVRKFRPTPGSGLAFLGLHVRTAFGVPFAVRADGSIGFDVNRSVLAVHSIAGNKEAIRAFMRTSGLLRSQQEASALERVWGHFNPEAVSTAVILRLANEQHIPIYTIGKSNVQQIIGSPFPLGGSFKNVLQVPEGIKRDIFNSINLGRVVTIPQQEVTIGSWKGTGYVVEDPATGAAAYLLTGGQSGGNVPFSHLCALDLSVLQALASLDVEGALSDWVISCLKELLGFDDDRPLQELMDCAVRNNAMPGDPAVNLRIAGIIMTSTIPPTILAYIAPSGLFGSLYNNIWVPMMTGALYRLMREFLCR